MRVLLVGSGAREHALAAALAASPLLQRLFIAPGNPGTAAFGHNVPIEADDVGVLVEYARAQRIDLVLPGPEAPLVAGLADACAAAGIACAGPSAAAARLEGSKSFSKQVCEAAGIPTARWERFTDAEAARAFVRLRGAPIVVKADGLAGGKGVVVAATLAEAEAAIDALMRQPGAALVIEECLDGEELSLFALCDGADAVLIGAAQDHKRVGEDDTGANTGGMGAISPPPGFDRAAQQRALGQFIRPALAELVRRGTPFRGVLFAGLMRTAHGLRLIEYNVRFGDPEAQALLMRRHADLLPALAAMCEGRLADCASADWASADWAWHVSDDAAIAVVLAARGYPGTPATGGAIAGLDRAAEIAGVRIFHGATRLDPDGILRGDGGRVLTVCAAAPRLIDARDAAYAAIARIEWPDGIWRRDIGVRALKEGAR